MVFLNSIQRSVQVLCVCVAKWFFYSCQFRANAARGQVTAPEKSAAKHLLFGKVTPKKRLLPLRPSTLAYRIFMRCAPTDRSSTTAPSLADLPSIFGNFGSSRVATHS